MCHLPGESELVSEFVKLVLVSRIVKLVLVSGIVKLVLVSGRVNLALKFDVAPDVCIQQNLVNLKWHILVKSFSVTLYVPYRPSAGS